MIIIMYEVEHDDGVDALRSVAHRTKQITAKLALPVGRFDLFRETLVRLHHVVSRGELGSGAMPSEPTV